MSLAGTGTLSLVRVVRAEHSNVESVGRRAEVQGHVSGGLVSGGLGGLYECAQGFLRMCCYYVSIACAMHLGGVTGQHCCWV